MNPKSLFLLDLIIITTSVVELKPPQVHEVVDETPPGFIRQTRQPTQRFNFLEQIQVDQQRWRYHQQQQIDTLNRFRNKFSSLRKREVRRRNSKRQLAHPLNYGLDHAHNVKLLGESFGGSQQQEYDIRALSALIGQTPTAQIQGLKLLLGPQDHTPIMEHVIDVVNPETHPNIKVEPAEVDPQKGIKQQNSFRIAQLNLVAESRARAAALEEAQRNALAQVEKDTIEQTRALYDVQYQPVLYQHEAVEDNKHVYGDHKDLQYASQYAFGYQVRDYHSGNNFGHQEFHDGKTAKGHYHVLLPDGRMQNVQYWADETGFHAKVTYDKLARH